MKTKKRTDTFIIVFVLQGRPLVIFDEELESPKVFKSRDEAMALTTSGHMGLTAAESICILNCRTGETEML